MTCTDVNGAVQIGRSHGWRGKGVLVMFISCGKIKKGIDGKGMNIYRAFFPVCRKVWMMTFWKVPSAGGLIL